MAERDYRKEYQRRIDNALKAGFSRSQGAGHARVGERGIRDVQEFFRQKREQLKDMIKDVNRIFEPVDIAGNCDVGYMDAHHRILSRWYVGGDDCQMNRADMQKLWDAVNRERVQHFYAITVTGVTEEPYPGKQGELYITLSYRLHRSRIINALNNKSNRTIADVVNAMLLPDREEQWMTIDQVTIIDKE